jgi:hypothetical protein
MYLNDVFTVPPRSPGCLRCRCRAGLNSAGLPLGLQIIGKALRRAGRAECEPGARRTRGLHGTTGEMVVSNMDRDNSELRVFVAETLRAVYRIQGATGEWEVVIGLEVHAQITRTPSCFPARRRVRRGAEHAGELVDAAMPGMLPVPNRECIRRRCAPAWRSTRRSTNGRGLTARIISTPICRRATRSASSITRWWARADRDRLDDKNPEADVKDHRHRAHPCRAGRGQADARSASDHVLCRPQPLGRGADGNRQRPGYALACRSRGLSLRSCGRSCAMSARATATWTRARCARRQRLGAQAGRRIRHAHRDEERQLGALRDAGVEQRGAPPGRCDRGWRHDGAGNPAVRSRQGTTRSMRSRKMRTIIAISPIPICCRWNWTTRFWKNAAPACPNCPMPSASAMKCAGPHALQRRCADGRCRTARWFEALLAAVRQGRASRGRCAKRRRTG